MLFGDTEIDTKDVAKVLKEVAWGGGAGCTEEHKKWLLALIIL